MELPVIDLSALRAGRDPGDLPDRLDAACRDTGFFALEGHGIADDTRAAVFDAARRFFDLPIDAKERVAIGRSACHRGYVGIAAETLETIERGAPADLKEAFDLSRDLGPEHPEVMAGTPLYGPNQWPELDGFRPAVEAYYEAAFDAALHLSRGLALALGLEQRFFVERMWDTISNLRLIHYPPQRTRQPEPGQPGCGSHTDYGLVTLLAQDDVGGLEVRHRSGDWVPIHTEPHQLVVNLGDMMARWSGDRWVSTMHRVRTPERDDRYSIPLFVNPNFHTLVETLPIERGGGTEYPPVTAGEYLLSRFDTTHSYRR